MAAIVSARRSTSHTTLHGVAPTLRRTASSRLRRLTW